MVEENPEGKEEDTPESEPEQSEKVEEKVSEEVEASGKEGEKRLENLDDEDLDRVLDQYIHYGEVAIETTNQRIKMNRFFGVILTSILAGLFALAKNGLTDFGAVAVLFASVAGGSVSYFWYKSLESYRRLNGARYTIMNRLEAVLPVPLYLDEWRYLKREKPDPEIIDPREGEEDHVSHTIVELWFVRAIAAGYITIGAYAIGFILTPILRSQISCLPVKTITGLWSAIIAGAAMAAFYTYRYYFKGE